MHRLARRAALPLGACAVLPTSRPRAEERAPAVQRRLTAVADLAIEAQLFQPAVPWPQWDCNWDHRELDSRGCDLRVLKCRGAFTPSTRLVSIRRGREWFLLRFRGRSDRVERPRCSAQVSGANIKEVAEAGVDMFVAGSAIFRDPRTEEAYKKTIDAMRDELAAAKVPANKVAA